MVAVLIARTRPRPARRCKTHGHRLQDGRPNDEQPNQNMRLQRASTAPLSHHRPRTRQQLPSVFTFDNARPPTNPHNGTSPQQGNSDGRCVRA